MRKLIALSLLLCGWVGFAARVVKVGNNQDFVITTAEGNWRVGDQLCLFETKREVGCGVVAQKTSDKLGIKLTIVQGAMRAGQYLTLRRDSRIPASTQGTSEDVLPTNPHHTFDIAGGITAGFNYFYPMVHAQVALNDSLSLGIEPLYFSSTEVGSKISGGGAFVTLNYYYTHFPFRGFFFQGGLGFYSMNVEYTGGSEKVSPFATEFSAQWRGKAYWGVPLDIGVGVGFQYLFPTNPPVAIGFDGLLPLFTAYLGFSL